ncbi:hypothetical protein K474DRAFT_1704934 [Panus rudis PR-1116 ss-1]|nr:hypothetical protein K474DRAFT_1704934 [Panus rudis PR-1116 ss-1]
MTVMLNEDVLVYIMSYIDSSRDVLSTMSTCKTMHDAGLSVLFSKRWLPISSRPTSVLPYVHKHKERRAPMLRSVIIHPGMPADPRVLEVLTYASNLRELSIPNGEEFFSYSRLLHAITALTSLRNLIICGVGPIALKAVECIRSPLTSLTLIGKHDSPRLVLSPLLDRFSDSLRELSATFVDFQPTSQSFPHIHRLQLALSQQPTAAGDLVTAFPNVRALSLCDVSSVTSQHHLPQHESRQMINSPSWKSLDYLKGDPEVLHNMSIDCPVRHLYLEPLRFMSNMHFLQDVFPSLQPRFLTVAGLDPTSLVKWRPMFKKTPSVTHMHVDIFTGVLGSEFATISAYVTQILHTVKPLPLRYLELCFKFYHAPGTVPPSDVSDFAKLVRETATAQPSLQYVLISSENSSLGPPSMWKVIGDGNDVAEVDLRETREKEWPEEVSRPTLRAGGGRTNTAKGRVSKNFGEDKTLIAIPI